jgi:menaquinone-dependent protoporphyrinogen oxidase
MKVLVAYESKHGSTKAIAERIATTLSAHDLDAVARPIHESAGFAGYDAYVIGSAVYYGGWMKEAVEFVREHEFWLVDKPVWLFSSGPIGTSLPADPREMSSLRETTQPRDHHVFYGALDRDELSIGERLIVGALKAPDGDFRDWNEIEHWADGIAQQLNADALVKA